MQIFLQDHPTYLYNCGVSIVTVVSLRRNYCSTVRNHSLSEEQFFVHSSFRGNGAGNNSALAVLAISLHCTETEIGIDYLNIDRPTDQLAKSLTHSLTAPTTQSAALGCTELSWAKNITDTVTGVFPCEVFTDFPTNSDLGSGKQHETPSSPPSKLSSLLLLS
jgi:hypothetical protein